MDISLKDRESVERWLDAIEDEQKRRSAALVLAVRSALRVMPLLARWGKFTPSAASRDIVLPSFRAMAVTWVGVKYLSHGADLVGSNHPFVIAASAAHSAADRSAGLTAADDAVLGADWAARAIRDAARASFAGYAWRSAARAIEHASSAAAGRPLRGPMAHDADHAAAATFWRLVNADARLIEESGPQYALGYSLWLDMSARLFDEEWNALTARLPSEEHWDVWLSWYEALRDGRDPKWSEAEAVKIVTLPEALWKAGPAEVNGEIKRILGSKDSSPRSGRIIEAPVKESVRATDSAETSLLRRSTNADPGSKLRRETVKESQKTKFPQKPLEKREAVTTHSDEPTDKDALGRRPFARALVERMDEVRHKGGGDGFAVHIHAPWGAGKTSVLKMMEGIMTSSRIAEDRWVVVHFNAWKNERRNPPWWPLIHDVFTSCRNALWKDGSWRQLLQLQWRWMRWRLIVDWLAYLVTTIVLGVVIYFLWFADTEVARAPATLWDYLRGLLEGRMPSPEPKESGFFDRASNAVNFIVETVAKLLGAFAAAFATFMATGRAIAFGSSDNAKYYADLSSDPVKRIINLFQAIIEKTKKPVCIFIDDMDRCNADYVVDLLEGMQTLFRSKDVAYIVAADRTWIKASFEKRYGTFAGQVGDSGQPLGYLFLEKIFQVTTPIPGMGSTIHKKFWNSLIDETAFDSAQQTAFAGNTDAKAEIAKTANREFDQKVEQTRQDIKAQFGKGVTRADMDTFLAEKGSNAETRAAAALELSASPVATKESEHLLSGFSHLVSENPRVMKRMVNAFALRQAIGILEGSGTKPATLARWTILEQRWPALADLLIENPERLDLLSIKLSDAKLKAVEADLKPFVNRPVLRSVIGTKREDRLSVERIREITRGSAS